MNNQIIAGKFYHSNIFRVSLFSLCAGITLNNAICVAAPTAKLNKWQFNPKSQQLEITLSTSTTPEYFYLAEPPRLVIDLPNTQLGNVDTQKNYSGKIQKIRVSQFSPNITRIVIDLEPGSFVDTNQVKLQPTSPKNPTRWVLRPVISHNSISAINQPSSSSFTTLPPPTTNLPINQQPFVIVPPLNSQNPAAQSNLIILPANSPSSAENTNLMTVPNSQNYTQPVPNIPVIEFGQPLPTAK